MISQIQDICVGYEGHEQYVVVTEIIDTAKRLKEYRTTFYTCHCTGIKAYESMRCIMGSQLSYVHSGEEIRLEYQKGSQEERRKQFMKWHKFFAWGDD